MVTSSSSYRRSFFQMSSSPTSPVNSDSVLCKSTMRTNYRGHATSHSKLSGVTCILLFTTIFQCSITHVSPFAGLRTAIATHTRTSLPFLLAPQSKPRSKLRISNRSSKAQHIALLSDDEKGNVLLKSFIGDEPPPPSVKMSSTKTGEGCIEEIQILEKTQRSNEKDDRSVETQKRPSDVNSNKIPLQILLIDNYDSYTYNLYQYLCEILSYPPIVITNDACSTWKEVEDHVKKVCNRNIDGVVLSPGPGSPTVDVDVGICKQAILDSAHIPILGVCLGHQLLAHLNGCVVNHAKRPMHGRISTVRQQTFDSNHIQETPAAAAAAMSCLFHSIPTDFNVTRYHSLSVQLPNCTNDGSRVRPLAYSTDDGEIMACFIDDKPHLGVQLHPESVGTEYGKDIIRNWCEFALRVEQKKKRKVATFQWDDYERITLDVATTTSVTEMDESSRGSSSSGVPTADNFDKESNAHPLHVPTNQEQKDSQATQPYRVFVHKYTPSVHITPESVFHELYSEEPLSFWLDSSNAPCQPSADHVIDDTTNNRFSIMGAVDSESNLSHFIEYWGAQSENLEEKMIKITKAQSESAVSSLQEPHCDTHHDHEKDASEQNDYIDCNQRICATTNSAEVSAEMICGIDILTYLQSQLSSSTTSCYELINKASIESGTIDDVDVIKVDERTNQNEAETTPQSALPFGYRGGYVGYIGYEVRHDTQRHLLELEKLSESSGSNHDDDDGKCIQEENRKESAKLNKNSDVISTVPDAAFIFADRSLVFDHYTGYVYLIGYASANAENNNSDRENLQNYEYSVEAMLKWMQKVHGTLDQLDKLPSHSQPSQQHFSSTLQTSHREGTVEKLSMKSPQNMYKPSSFTPLRPKSIYEKDIDRCHLEIRNGESYELCLTNKFVLEESYGVNGNMMVDPYEVYQELRSSNQAPFAAFLRFDPRQKLVCKNGNNIHDIESDSPNFTPTASVAICCSSPERFLSLSSTNTLESKPIKGTTPRGSNISTDLFLANQLQTDEKNLAENLMIVDLVRNDFGRVCEVGSVHVPKLCAIESFRTVHQLVSTIRGTLSSNHGNPQKVSSKNGAMDAIIACFPGGSMTGAPKLRTMEIINDMEQEQPRGPYAGSIGFVSLNGVMDMNICIRTAVVTPSRVDSGDDGFKVSVGAGGAITALSDCEDEYQEMLLKSRVVVDSVLRVMNRKHELEKHDQDDAHGSETVVLDAEGSVI